MDNDMSPPRFRFRRPFVAACVTAVAAVLVWQMADLQLNQNAFLKDQGDARHVRIVTIPAHRGILLDRNGEPLAASTPVASVWMNPKEIADPRPEWGELETLLELAPGTVDELLEDRGARQFVYMRRHVDPSTADAVSALGLAGVHLQREYRRYYPMGAAAGHVLGFTDVDDMGQEGLELAFDDVLTGRSGEKQVIKDRLGRVVESVERIRSASPGGNVVLSIDRRIQSLTYRALVRGVKQHRARAGTAVVLDVRTGEVLAIANQPSFNPNDRSDRAGRRSRNRAVTDVLEPGSSIKPFTVAAALLTGIASPDTIIDTRPGFLRVGGHTIWDIRNYGVIDVQKVIKKSSNVGAGKLALKLRPRDLWHMLHAVGFGTSSGSRFPGEVPGTLSDFVGWRDVHRVTLSYGYGLAVTPLQLARAYAAFGNDGALPDINFLKIDSAPQGTPAMPVAIAAQMRRMLEQVVEPGGTGRRAGVDGYRVGGKTGTSRKSEAGGYSEDRYHAVFAGLAPMSDPRLSVVVVIDEPGGDEYYGGVVAAPVFSDIVEGSLRVLGIAPDDPGKLPRTTISVAAATPGQTLEQTQ